MQLTSSSFIPYTHPSHPPHPPSHPLHLSKSALTLIPVMPHAHPIIHIQIHYHVDIDIHIYHLVNMIHPGSWIRHEGYLHHAHGTYARLNAPIIKGHATSVSKQILFPPIYFRKKKQLQQKQQQQLKPKE